MTSWFDFKVLLIELTGLSRDALHVMLGVAVQLGFSSLPRQSLSRPLPWLAVFLAASLNELYDLSHETWPDVTIQNAESIKDVLVTMTVPTLLLIAARYAPGLVLDRTVSPCNKDEALGEPTQDALGAPVSAKEPD